MKKIISAILALTLFGAAAGAYNFPEPDWGVLLSERKAMETSTDFELYVEGSPESAPYYGAKLEPRAGTYLGMIAEYSEPFLPLGSYLTYVQDFGQPDLYYPANSMIRNDNVVTMVGWTVNSLDDVDYDVIRAVLDKLSAYNKPMFIRFANEMNCSALGDDPDRYIQVFRNVANMVHEYPNFAVVWSPNDMGALDRPFEYYYPGDEYVDWVGISCYMTKYFTNEPNTKLVDSQYFMTGDYAWATNKIKPFMKFLSDYGIQKPIMISEGGVARLNSFGDDYTGWNEPRMRNMLWNIIMKYPQVKMINYFNRSYGNFGEHYYFTDYQSSVDIFNEAAANGAYLRSADASPNFVFSPANNGETLAAHEGIVKLYTLAYFANRPDVTVTYKIDGVWIHETNSIPYICNFDINSITDGEHTLTIEAAGQSKQYKLYKRGNAMCFGREPDPSAIQAPDVPAPSDNTAAVFEDAGVSVVLKGKELSFEQPPVIADGRTLVPLRAIFEAMAAAVDWDQDTKTATARRGRVTVEITIGDNRLYKNGEAVELDVPAQLVNDRTMVPARAVAEAFDAVVGWDGDSRTVTIEY